VSLLPSRGWVHLALVVLLAFGIAGFAQAIAERHSRRFDFTPSRSLSLSGVSRRVLEELRDPIEVTAYTSRDDRAKVAEVMDLFRGASPNFRYELLDLDRNPGRARTDGVDRYGRAVLRYRARTVIVDAEREPAIGAGLALLARGRAPRVAFLSGHGERSPAEMTAPVGYGQLRQALEQMSYDVGGVSLLRSGEVPSATDLLIVAGPESDVLDAEAEAMERYLAAGGHVMLLVDPVPLPNLSRLAARHGIDTPLDVIVDRSNRLFASDPLTVPIPTYLPHPITASSRAPALFAVARSVVAEEAPSGAGVSLVAETDPDAWGIRDLGRAADPRGDPRPGEDRRGPVGVVAAASWPGKQGEARLVVVGDSDFASNSFLDLLGNRDLVLNAIGWSVSAEERIAEHAPSEVTMLRPLSPFVLSTRAAHEIFVALVIVEPTLVLAFGVALALRRRWRG
jgi:hypothetical protein